MDEEERFRKDVKSNLSELVVTLGRVERLLETLVDLLKKKSGRK